MSELPSISITTPMSGGGGGAGTSTMSSSIVTPSTFLPSSSDDWTVRELLLMAESVHRLGEGHWVAVARLLKAHVNLGPRGNHELRDHGFFSQKNCAQKYGVLLEQVGTPKRKRQEASMEQPGVRIMTRLAGERAMELREIMSTLQTRYEALKNDIDDIDAGKYDSDLSQLIKEAEVQWGSITLESVRVPGATSTPSRPRSIKLPLTPIGSLGGPSPSGSLPGTPRNCATPSGEAPLDVFSPLPGGGESGITSSEATAGVGTYSSDTSRRGGRRSMLASGRGNNAAVPSPRGRNSDSTTILSRGSSITPEFSAVNDAEGNGLKGGSISLGSVNIAPAENIKDWKKRINVLMKSVTSHQNAHLFMNPITNDIAPGYHDLVMRPLDLKSLKKRIDEGTVGTTAECYCDLMHMFQNALFYNDEQTTVWRAALSMRADVQRKMQDFINVERNECGDSNETNKAYDAVSPAMSSASKDEVTSSRRTRRASFVDNHDSKRMRTRGGHGHDDD